MKAASHCNGGCVTLVGAGPGDPELLTIKAVRAIAQATVILVDDLVSAEVLAHKSADARVVYVGKRAGRISSSQAFIEKLMVREARRGERVVRLKGGDPLIFGRGAEEIAALRAAGVDHAIINGVTAGLAAASSLGIALTHREHTHGLLWLTGHPHAGGEGLDWEQVGRVAHSLKLSLVIYMGLTHAASIQAQLLKNLSAHTPVALVQRVSEAGQKIHLATLDALAATIAQQHIQSPATIVVGEVVREAHVLQTVQARSSTHASDPETPPPAVKVA